MKNTRTDTILYRFLHPSPAVILSSCVLTAAGLVWALHFHHEGSPAAYVLYLFSFWTLVVSVIRIGALLRRLLVFLLPHLPLVNRLVRDIRFRTAFFLAASLVVNIVYALLYLVPGIRHLRFWNITIGLVYLILAAGRFRLSRYGHLHRGKPVDLLPELQLYVTTAWTTMTLDVLIAGATALMIRDGEGWSYGPITVIAIAAYTFYMLGLSIYGLIRYRAFHSPVLLATRYISFAGSLFSFLPLASGLIRAYGDGTDGGPLLALTGAVIFAAVLLPGLHAVVSGRRQIAALQE